MNRNEFNARLKSLAPLCVRIPDDGKVLRPGQLWSVRGGCGDQPTWLVILMEVLDVEKGIANFFPAFRWGELAARDHVRLPGHFAGTVLHVCLDMQTTLAKDALDQCFDRISTGGVDYIHQAEAVLEDEVNRHTFLWGSSYVDELDHRLPYHQSINERLEELQGPIIDLLFE